MKSVEKIIALGEDILDRLMETEEDPKKRMHVWHRWAEFCWSRAGRQGYGYSDTDKVEISDFSNPHSHPTRRVPVSIIDNALKHRR